MDKFIKYFYVFLTASFLILTSCEIFIYMKMESNYVGIFYLFFNFFIMFLLFSISINYDKSTKNIRISKNIIAILLGIFTSFVLTLIIPHIFGYTDSSYLFEDSIFIIGKIIKPIVYALLGVVSVLELKFTSRNN